MHTSRLRRCAPDLRLILWRGNVLRLRRPVARGTVALGAWSVATPQSEGLVRVRGQVGLRTPAPDPWGRYRTSDPWREGRPAPVPGLGCARPPNPWATESTIGAQNEI